MATIIAKNIRKFDIMITDLGISIPKFNQIELVGSMGGFNIFEVTSSTVLKVLVTNGDIIINDGIVDLSTVNGIKHLTLTTKYEGIK